MRILCIIQRYYPAIGGAEILTKSLMDHLSKNHEVVVCTSNAQDIRSFWNKNTEKISVLNPVQYTVNRYEIVTSRELNTDEYLEKFPLASNYPGPFLPQLWNDLVCNPIEYDLIFVTAYPYDHILPAYVAAKKWKIPIVIMPLLHQEFPELYLSSMKLTMLDNADGIFVLSESEKTTLTNYAIDPSKISVLPIPISVDEWEGIDSSKFRQKISLKPEQKIILFTGSKAYVKGIIHLIEALRILWKKRDDVFLVIIGPTTKEYEDYISKIPSSMQKNIIDLGAVDDKTKKEVFSSCDILAVPSKSESFGMVYLEAWLCKKPVIGCDIIPISEIIQNKKNGLLVKFGDVNELNNAITYLIENPNICNYYGVEGNAKIRKLDSKKILQDFENKCVLLVNNFKNQISE